jgi:tetratricopeptide (TPR) repeat protein
MKHALSWFPVLLLLSACGKEAPPPATAPANAAAPHYFDDLGTLHRAISSKDPEAQRWFDHGLRLTYAFNHEAAGRSFAEALKHDPECAICYWGQALVLGPNINLPMQPDAVGPAFEASQRAMALQARASLNERALIDALAHRYEKEPPTDRKALDQAYAAAMRSVVQRYPDDLDAATLYAEALMDLSPWAYWDKQGQPTSPNTPELVGALESVLKRAPDHIGAAHYYIHAVEASANPERAEPYADRLAALAPGAGHLVHMPAHIYIRVGRYHDATLNNLKATEADANFLHFCRGSNGIYPLGYVPHNWHFMSMTAGLEGNSARALQAADETAKRADKTRLEQLNPMQVFLIAPYFLDTRFARWDRVLSEQAPPSELPYPAAMWHWARGRAHAGKGDLDAAGKELALVEAAARDPALEKLVLWEINVAARVVAVAAADLRGAIAAARGDHAAAVAAYQDAAKAEDALNYNEPPDWMLPTRQFLGAEQLAAGKPKDAEQSYRDDLKTYPRNGWSLRGLELALAAQGRDDEAKATHEQFVEAWKNADVVIEGSRL